MCFSNGNFQFPFRRGVARKFLEGGLKSSKMSVTIVRRQRQFWVKDRLKRYISDLFQPDFTDSNLSLLAAELFFLT